MSPINSKVIVEMHTPMDVTASGIHIPPSWQKPSGHANVVAVAKSCKHVKVGDHVAFRWIDGRDVDFKDGRKLKSLQEAEILAIVNPSQERERELDNCLEESIAEDYSNQRLQEFENLTLGGE